MIMAASPSTTGLDRHLSDLLTQAAQRRPKGAAVEDEHGRVLSYAELDREADRLAAWLARSGVGRGDRVGVFLPKSLEAVSAIHGILRSGAAYVPVDPTAPVPRGAGILHDAGVKSVVVAAPLAQSLREHWPGPDPLPRLIVVGPETRPSLAEDPNITTWESVLGDEAPSSFPSEREPEDLAYILYTSGSTGVPKGVMLTHANAFCFLDWCSNNLSLSDDDRFSSHAPFHFDLSVFDLYMSCRHAAPLVLISEALGKEPARLARFLHERKISVWYSAPSILALMAQFGELDAPGRHTPLVVLFAGEVFPIQHLRRLRAIWPRAEMWNLYGPTETNVCTAFRIPDQVPEDRDRPFPIGWVCPPLKARVVDEQGAAVGQGHIGELVIEGPGVMRGYHGRNDLTDQAFFTDLHGDRWYRTGDLVVDDGTGCHDFHGRRDRMVKRRGYRIELGEIEAALYRHPGVERAAVIAQSNEQGTTITAFLTLGVDQKKSLVALKRHCADHLPSYMIPDSIVFLGALPTTSTDKVDYQSLKLFAVSQNQMAS